ncbi:hypothetical protein HanXRQr2_Chr09g0366391 [Helianthus annuus]|uniref:Uncharacterized protein n=1 Tax=Helianthus annuus TaxID=4232 RepID=A0A9K3I2L0_HELAN|nr:hypothetical protein HanXRQr2_Chr09g0366391 [Helianthus annuus]
MLTLNIHLIYYSVVLELQYPSFQILTHVLPQTTPATTDVSVKEKNIEETYPSKDVTIKQEEIQVIPEVADLDDDKWWCDNINNILEMFKLYHY